MSLSLETIIARLDQAREDRAPLTVRYVAASGSGKGGVVTRYFLVTSEILTSANGGLYVRTVECEGPGPRAGRPLTEQRIARDSEGDVIYDANGEPRMVNDDKCRTLTVAAWTPSQDSGITTLREGIVTL